MPRGSGGPVVIRTDATRRIGSGHAMRCMAVATALARLGCPCVFVVSCDESARFIAERGFEAEVLPGDEMAYTRVDAKKLRLRCSQLGARELLIDSYAVDSGFFDSLSEGLMADVRVTYLDGMYSYVLGQLEKPVVRPVDAIVNPNFFADVRRYETAYAESSTELYLGVSYAALRGEFHRDPVATDPMRAILVTVGSSNPGGALERLVEICLGVVRERGIAVHAVVGPMASYDGPTHGVVLHRGESMAQVMSLCQAAVSAAGTTIIELAALGMPTIAVEIADNQRNDVSYYVQSEMGLGCSIADEDERIAGLVGDIVCDSSLRRRLRERCISRVDCRGAERTARAILGMGDGSYDA